jgi:hypothetical protein
MADTFLPTLKQIRQCFAQEIRNLGGSVCDTFEDAERLYMRSIRPQTEEVRPGDAVQGGVALRSTGPTVVVQPYVFRQVCRNGAIMAHALEGQELTRIEEGGFEDPDSVLGSIREAVQACAAPTVFAESARHMRLAGSASIDHLLVMGAMLMRIPAAFQQQFIADLMQRLQKEGDRTRFGLMNAVTAHARDMRDPELRWRLEELGGALAVSDMPVRQPDDAAGRLVQACR